MYIRRKMGFVQVCRVVVDSITYCNATDGASGEGTVDIPPGLVP